MTSLLPGSDALYAWMIGLKSHPTLTLPPGGVAPLEVLMMLRDLLSLAVSMESQSQVVGQCDSGEQVLKLCEELSPSLLVIGCAIATRRSVRPG